MYFTWRWLGSQRMPTSTAAPCNAEKSNINLGHDNSFLRSVWPRGYDSCLCIARRSSQSRHVFEPHHL